MPDDEYQKYERACKRIKKDNAKTAGAVRAMALGNLRQEAIQFGLLVKTELYLSVFLQHVIQARLR